MGSSFGKLFTISSFGESHGGGVGVIIDGCPPRLELDINEIQNDLNRRRPGQSKITTPRNESDEVEILSGLLGNKTLGTPIAMVVRNKDHRPKDYSEIKKTSANATQKSSIFYFFVKREIWLPWASTRILRSDAKCNYLSKYE